MSTRKEPAEEFVIARCTASQSSNTLEHDGKRIVLEPRVMDLLVTFASQPDHVFSRDELVEIVWRGRLVSDEAVNRAVFELRKAFRELGVRREVIVTVRKRGYRLRGKLAPVTKHADVAHGRQLLLAVLVMTVALVGWLLVGDDKPTPENATEPEIVLRLGITSGNPGDQAASVLSRTLAKSIATGLATQDGLIVRLPDEPSDAPPLMLSLRPDYRLEGLLEKDGGFYTLKLELTAVSGAIVWAGLLEFSATTEQIEAIRTSVSRPVSMALLEHFRETESCRWVDDISVLESYYEAKRLISLRGESNIREAILMLKEIIGIAPDFAQAWSLLAWAYGLLPAHIEDREQAAREVAVLDPMADQAAQMALEICPTLAEAFLLVGSTTEYSGDNHLIQHEYILRRALSLDPGNSEITRHAADMLFRRGRIAESKALMQRALEIDPYNARLYREMADYALNERDFALATQLLNEADRLGYQGKRYPWWRLFAQTGDWKELVQAAPDALRPTMKLLAATLADPDDTAKRQAAMAALEDAEAVAPHDGLVLAHYGAIWLGDGDLAWEALRKIDLRSSNLHSVWWSEGVSFRAHPMFEWFWQEMNLLEYWLHMGPPDFCDLRETTLVCPENI